jgi:hypothetical protein
MDKVPYFLLNIIDSLILIVVMAIAIVIMLCKVRSLGKAAFLGAAGFFVLGAALLLDIAQGAWFMFVYSSRSYSQEILETVHWIKTGIATLLSVIGSVLLIIAIVIKRPVDPEPKF